MNELKIYRCEKCGKIVVALKDTESPTICCGEPMKLLKANSTEAATEKHVPVVTREGNKVTVTVGSVEHPMTPEHYIQFIILVTEKDFRVAYLNPGDRPSVDFYEDEKVIAVYEYCNLHGLWKTEA
jgi:superoxide reductase